MASLPGYITVEIIYRGQKSMLTCARAQFLGIVSTKLGIPLDEILLYNYTGGTKTKKIKTCNIENTMSILVERQMKRRKRSGPFEYVIWYNTS
ncbi:hypothetical protein NPIL_601791 [Nephila pilipes]|uniref:Uncharacterized protein n=1 Tax=Nephila pilipes TaxID=299642 RepID=A0A8X6QEK2_NEPPI|nr:hypothetical protein NPIL_601791 [Nephila pilipes]